MKALVSQVQSIEPQAEYCHQLGLEPGTPGSTFQIINQYTTSPPLHTHISLGEHMHFHSGVAPG